MSEQTEDTNPEVHPVISSLRESFASACARLTPDVEPAPIYKPDEDRS